MLKKIIGRLHSEMAMYLSYKLTNKLRQYGSVGIPEYWVVDSPNRLLHVFRQPTKNGYADETGEFYLIPSDAGMGLPSLNVRPNGRLLAKKHNSVATRNSNCPSWSWVMRRSHQMTGDLPIPSVA